MVIKPGAMLTPDEAAAEAHGDLQEGPSRWQAGVDGQLLAGRADAGETHDQGLPDSAHRLHVEPVGGCSRAIVEIDEGRHAQRVEGTLEAAGPGQERSVRGR